MNDDASWRTQCTFHVRVVVRDEERTDFVDCFIFTFDCVIVEVFSTDCVCLRIIFFWEPEDFFPKETKIVVDLFIFNYRMAEISVVPPTPTINRDRFLISLLTEDTVESIDNNNHRHLFHIFSFYAHQTIDVGDLELRCR